MTTSKTPLALKITHEIPASHPAHGGAGCIHVQLDLGRAYTRRTILGSSAGSLDALRGRIR
ncbi:unnamed protein product [Diplocarpon coronariae]